MNEDCCAVVMTAAGSEQEAKRITESLLEKRLAACIQHVDISSHYCWENEICNNVEILLLIKCRASLYSEIEDAIRAEHSYEVPEIVCVPVTGGFPPYLNWIDEVSASGHK